MQIIQSPSTNHYNGRNGYKPELIVVHITDGYFPGDLNWLRGASQPPVSSSYFIAPDGTAHQLVDDANGAWHAGRILNPTFKLFKGMNINPNWYTIGIEVSCKPPAVPTPAQMIVLKQLIKELCVKHNIPVDRDHVIGHKEIFSAKTCPGPINMDQLVAEMAVVPPPTMVDKEEFKKKIINYIQSL